MQYPRDAIRNHMHKRLPVDTPVQDLTQKWSLQFHPQVLPTLHVHIIIVCRLLNRFVAGSLFLALLALFVYKQMFATFMIEQHFSNHFTFCAMNQLFHKVSYRNSFHQTSRSQLLLTNRLFLILVYCNGELFKYCI